MLFEFPTAIKAGITAGKYLQVVTNTGIPIGMARDAVTGQFVSHAIGVLGNTGIPLNPIALPVQLLTSGLEMYQMHRGFQSVEKALAVQMYQIDRGFQSVEKGLHALQTSVAVLQSTTAVLGIAGVALSAVNLHQTLKLKKAVEKLEIRVDQGFVDLSKEMKSIAQDLKQDLKFEQHRTILIQSYGRFATALDRLCSAIHLQDLNRRDAEIDAVRNTLFHALADYRNPHLLEEVSAPSKLRRLECAWAIEQGIISTYQMQGELAAVNERIYLLDKNIRQDAVTTLESCANQAEFDFIAPEISRIRSHDLEMLQLWKNQNDWMRSLSAVEKEDLQNTNFIEGDDERVEIDVTAEPIEYLEYQQLQENAYPGSMKDLVFFMVDRDHRQQAESYINKQAITTGYKGLTVPNLQASRELDLANLYWYFKDKDNSAQTQFV